jgi:DNA-directed RNA polymerase specialized sigma24 family protein
MSEETPNLPGKETRLDQIATNWSLLRLAHQNSVTAAGAARNALVLRYSGAIRKFLGILVHQEQDADELSQEILVRMLRGDFARAAPERGRFRDYLAVAARNLVKAYWSRKARQTGQDLDVNQFAAPEADESPYDDQLIATWRRSLLDMAWSALEEYQRTHKGSVSFTLLRLRADFPDDDSEQLAARLSEILGRPVRADAVRQQLRRARLRFAEFLLEEVARGLDDPTPERVEEELIEIGLMDYVRDFLPPDWRTRGELQEARE